MNLKFLAINIFLCLLSKSFAYQTRKYGPRPTQSAIHKSTRLIHFLSIFLSLSSSLCFFLSQSKIGQLCLSLILFAGSLTELCPPGNSLQKSFSTLFRTMREVHLGENDQSAALVQFSWNSSNFKRYEDCKFRVIATIIDDKTRNRGVFVSIRRLNLRKSPITADCVDFIRFTFGKTKSPKYCGQLNASVDDVKKIYFGEGGGIIDVQIRLDTFQPLRKEFDTLDVELVFTANEGKRAMKPSPQFHTFSLEIFMHHII